MGALDGGLRTVVRKVVRAFVDTPSTLTRAIPPTYDPALGTETGGSTVTYSVFVSPPEAFLKRTLFAMSTAGPAIQRDDIKLILPALELPSGVAPKPTKEWSLTYQGRVYAIVHVDVEMSGDLPAAYVLQCR